MIIIRRYKQLERDYETQVIFNSKVMDKKWKIYLNVDDIKSKQSDTGCHKQAVINGHSETGSRKCQLGTGGTRCQIKYRFIKTCR